jgi:hypothetical protein
LIPDSNPAAFPADLDLVALQRIQRDLGLQQIFIAFGRVRHCDVSAEGELIQLGFSPRKQDKAYDG